MNDNITNNIINTSINDNSSIKHKISKHYPKRKKSRNTDYIFDNNQDNFQTKEVSINISNVKKKKENYSRNSRF